MLIRNVLNFQPIYMEIDQSDIYLIDNESNKIKSMAKKGNDQKVYLQSPKPWYQTEWI